MSSHLVGIVDWGVQKDEDGHRDYSLKMMMRNDSYLEGPAAVLNSVEVPQVGSTWFFGGDVDLSAYCWPNWRVSTVVSKEPNLYHILEQTFSTKPLRRCQDTPIENPLDEPYQVGGSFVKQTKHCQKDRLGAFVQSSSMEAFQGKNVEFDNNRPNVYIELNQLVLPLSTFAPMVDTVNDQPMWGLAKRMVKLSNVSWQRKLYGSCNFYYTIRYEFDIDYNTFDRLLADYGTRVLKGTAPGSMEPEIDPLGFDVEHDTFNRFVLDNFEAYTDATGNPGKVPLDGLGRPAPTPEDQGEILVEFYTESNFFDLGIPGLL